MDFNLRMYSSFEKKFDKLFKQIETALKSIPDSAFHDIKSPELQLVFGVNAQKPFIEEWEMIHAILTPVHNWQLKQLENGNYVWDDAGCITDVLVQIYDNDWIVAVNSATKVTAAFRPMEVKKIRSYLKAIKAFELQFSETYNAKIRAIAEANTEMPKITDICKEIVALADKTNQEPVDVFETMSARYDMEPAVFLKFVDNFYLVIKQG